MLTYFAFCDVAEQKTHRRLLIRPSYCDELLQLHRRLQDSEAAIVSATEAVAAKLKFPLSKIRVERHNAMFGVCCRIPKSKQRVLAKKPGIIQLAVQVCCYVVTLQPQRAVSHAAPARLAVRWRLLYHRCAASRQRGVSLGTRGVQ